MHYLRRDKKDEESVGGGNPFQNLDKTAVLQEARVFNETPINARKCCHILTKLLYILGQGEQINRTEATEAFFAVTKLWQSKDPSLRRLVFLAVKELSSMADDVIIVTSSLTKDMTGKDDAYRGAAVRALCKITDATMFQAIERYMKQAIVDKNPSVSTAALVSSLHLMKKTPEVVRRWVNEVQEAVNSDNIMVQFHALALLYKIRRTDRLAVLKLIQKLTKQGLKSPYALCFLIRLCMKMVEEDTTGTEVAFMFDFIESCLRHKCELVIYEAASALIRLPNISTKELSSAVSVLQLFCSSPKPTLRFAAVRALNKVAMNHPAAVVQCNVDLEQLISDQNRSIATLAITTLLKTGAESSIDRLMKQISGFVSEISDEFKIVVIDAIRSLCVRYPRKHAVMMGFLSTMLRDEGGYEYKKAIIDTIITIVEDNADAKEAGLAHLCEFIEDCEHAPLATKILHLLGREGPKSSNPSKYIRFIYNRVILESAQVRAAAVSALAKFGAQCDQLRESVCILLQRCLLDSDDEVRDRATCALALLRQEQLQLAKRLILTGLFVSAVGLEQACRAYLEDNNLARPFDLKSLPPTTVPIGVMETRKQAMPGGTVSAEHTAPAVSEPGGVREEKVKRLPQDIMAEKLKQIPVLAELGPLFKASDPVQLTEAETEYVIHCTKLAFQNHVVFKDASWPGNCALTGTLSCLQFDCRNTVNDHLLDSVTVAMEPDAENWAFVTQIPCDRLAYNQPSETYTIFELPDDPTCVTASFRCTLKFTVRDCDPVTAEPDAEEGFPDEYALEDVEVAVADHVVPMMKPNFQAFWEELGDEHHVENTYALSSMKTLQEAVKNLLLFMGLGVCDRSDKVGDGKTAHTLLLAGLYRGGIDVAARAKLALTPDGAVNMNLAVRSADGTVSQILAEAIS